MSEVKEVVWVIDWFLKVGIVGGSITLVWYIVRKMIGDFSVKIDKTISEVKTEMVKLKTDVDDRLKRESDSCKELRKGCMGEQKMERAKQLDTDLHKMICQATQNKFLLHVSEENRMLTEKLSKQIEENRRLVLDTIDNLRKDLKKNGSVK